METWFETNYTARVVSEERVREAMHEEHVVVDRISIEPLRRIFRSLLGVRD